MKLNLEEILKYIDDYAKDPTRRNYPLEERLRDINSEYFSILAKIDRMKGTDVTGTQNDNNVNDIAFAIGDTIKPLNTTTDVSYVTMTYDGVEKNLSEIFSDDDKTLATWREADATQPTVYVLRDDSIELLPKTDKAVDLHIWQSERPAKFDGTLTAEPRLVEDLHMYLVVRPMIKYFTKKDMAIPKNLKEALLELNEARDKIYGKNRRFKISFKQNLIR